jgi:hypothetical protein
VGPLAVSQCRLLELLQMAPSVLQPSSTVGPEFLTLEGSSDACGRRWLRRRRSTGSMTRPKRVPVGQLTTGGLAAVIVSDLNMLCLLDTAQLGMGAPVVIPTSQPGPPPGL